MADSDQVRAIKARYRRSLKDKAAVARDWLASYKAGGLTTEQTGEFAGWLHQLAGSAGMYQYEDIAESARALMAQVENDATIGNVLEQPLAALISQLESHADES